MSELDITEPKVSIEAEQGILGTALQHSEAIDLVRDIVEPDDFSEELHKALYKAMIGRRDEGLMIDVFLIKATLGNADLGGQTVGGYLANLARAASSLEHVKDYARTVKRAAQWRMMVTLGHELVRASDVALAGDDPGTAAETAIQHLDTVAAAGRIDAMRRISVGEASYRVLDKMQAARAGKRVRGVATGLPSLDAATYGWRGGQLIILAGRPAMGKSALACGLALAAASETVEVEGGELQPRQTVVIFSLEMDEEELTERLLASLAYRGPDRSVFYRDIAQGEKLTDDEVQDIADAHYKLRDLPLEIEPQPGITLSQLAARARTLKARCAASGKPPLGLIVVDHIGLMKASARYLGNRNMEVGEITTGLKVLAKELRVPVVALSQLNRKVEERDDKRPVMSDLRDSGSVEQDADIILTVYREAYYLGRKKDRTPEEDILLMEKRNALEIEILKQRMGPTKRLECFVDIGCNVISEEYRP